ncbi:MAG: DUF3179 domain-containing protein [Chloroflexi bacterium]|nr:DUF3179 domain-containing protein [Chloroflexota bacterium]
MWLIAGIAGKSGYLIVILLVGLVIALFFLPQIRQAFLKLRSEEVTISRPGGQGVATGESTLDLEIITVLGKDGIPSIDNPRFIDGDQAGDQMFPGERVLGVSINGDHRAYSLNLLSRHEIVNDTVGGVPVAVTW